MATPIQSDIVSYWSSDLIGLYSGDFRKDAGLSGSNTIFAVYKQRPSYSCSYIIRNKNYIRSQLLYLSMGFVSRY